MSEVDRRRGMLGDLQARREELERALASVNAEIADLASFDGMTTGVRRRGPGRPRGSRNKAAGVGRGGAGRGRGGNEKSLATRLHEILQGRTMNVADMAEAVKKAGHKSKSKNFRTVVGLALIGHKKMFKRVSRGQYTAK